MAWETVGGEGGIGGWKLPREGCGRKDGWEAEAKAGGGEDGGRKRGGSPGTARPTGGEEGDGAENFFQSLENA